MRDLLPAGGKRHFLAAVLLASLPVTSAQILESGSLSGGPAEIFITVIDSVTFAEIATLPDAAMMFAVVLVFYFILKNLLEKVFEAIESSVHNALNDRTRFARNDEYPTGMKGLAFVIGYIAANGVFSVIGLGGAIAIATLGVLLTVAKLAGFFGSSGEETSGEGTASGGGSTAEGGGEGDGGQSLASAVGDLAGEVSRHQAGPETKEERIIEALKYFEKHEDIEQTLENLKNRELDQLRGDVVDAKDEIDDETKIGKNELNNVSDRLEIIGDSLEKALNKHKLMEQTGHLTYDNDNDLRRFLDNGLPRSDIGSLKEQFEALKEELNRLQTEDKKINHELRDDIDDALDIIQDFYKVYHFLQEMPVQDIEQLRMSQDSELYSAVHEGKKLKGDLDRVHNMMGDVRQRRQQFYNLADELLELIEKDMSFSAREMNRIKKMLSSGSSRIDIGGKTMSLPDSLELLEENLELYYSDPAWDDPDGRALDYSNNELEDCKRFTKRCMSMVKSMEEERSTFGSYESDVVDKLRKLSRELK